jgi:hypothetical protein
MMRRLAAVLLLAAAAGCGSISQRTASEWERASSDSQEQRPREHAVALPRYPQERDLLEFEFRPIGSHRYFLDTQSLNVGSDGIVRYSVVVKTAGGAVNTSYEGIRCATREKRLYATGRGGNQWVEAKRSDWTEIRRNDPNEFQAMLYADAFCPGRLIVRSRDEALNALRASMRGRASNR